jgi:hypothetical protein
VHVGNVAVMEAAELRTQRRREHQLRETPRIAHGHLGRDPAAEAIADEHRVLQV